MPTQHHYADDDDDYDYTPRRRGGATKVVAWILVLGLALPFAISAVTLLIDALR